MTRASFLALFGLGAAAQTTKAPRPGESATGAATSTGTTFIHNLDTDAIPAGGFRVVANGRCTPKREGFQACAVSAPSVTGAPPRNGECPVCGTMAPGRAYLPSGKSLVISCLHCRVLFRQDAEEAK